MRDLATNFIETMVLPLELKTGNNKGNSISISHRAQVLLYSLLMSDFYSNDILINYQYSIYSRYKNLQLFALLFENRQHVWSWCRCK